MKDTTSTKGSGSTDGSGQQSSPGSSGGASGGSAEAQARLYRALAAAADDVAAQLDQPGKASTYIVYDAASMSDMVIAQVFERQIALYEESYEQSSKKMVTLFAVPAITFAPIDLVSLATTLLKVDAQFNAVTGPADAEAFVISRIAKKKLANTTFYYPSIVPLILLGDKKVANPLTRLFMLQAQVDADLKAASDNLMKETQQNIPLEPSIIIDLTSTVDDLTSLQTSINSLIKSLTAPPGGDGSNNSGGSLNNANQAGATAILRGWLYAEALKKEGTKILRVRVEMSGGTDRTMSFLFFSNRAASASAQLSFMTFHADGTIAHAGTALAYLKFAASNKTLNPDHAILLRDEPAPDVLSTDSSK